MRRAATPAKAPSHRPRSTTAAGDLYSWLTHYQPDYILRHEPRWDLEQSTELLEGAQAYAPADGFEVPGYVLLKKTGTHNDQQIAGMAARIEESRVRLDEMSKSSTIGAPYVVLDRGILLAHAPSTLRLVLSKPSKTILVSYGIREGAEGKHHGVCFEILRQSGDEKLFERCIDARARGDELYGRADIAFQGDAGETLTFKTVCQGPCAYAWAYWEKVVVE